MRFTRYVLAVLIVVWLSAGCTSMDVPKEFEPAGYHSSYTTNCEKPYVLTIGCSSWSKGEIPYKTDGSVVAIGSTEDGSVLFVKSMYLTDLATSVIEGATLFLADPAAQQLNKAVRAIKTSLSEAGIEIVEIRVVSNVNDLWGYYLITDGDALGALGLRGWERENDA